MDYYQRAEELERIATLLLDISSVSEMSKKSLRLQIDSAGMSEDELIDHYGERAADMILVQEYIYAYELIERTQNESHS